MMTDFIANLPKIELHAHLNGSLKAASILELAQVVHGAKTEKFVALTKKFTTFDKTEALDDCFQKFQFMHELTSTRIGLKNATEMIIRDFAADNVIYLELRTTPKANGNMTQSEYLTTVLDAIASAHLVKTNKIMVKLIPSIDRSKTIAQATETLRLVKELKAQNENYNNLLVGLDLSGNPKCGSFVQFKRLFEEARQGGLKLAFHCAEIDNPEEIREMLDFGMERCGHGTFLTDAQIAELYQRNIAIECCLTSNFKCKTVPNYEDHHFKRIFQHEKSKNCSKHLVVCTDDCGVFDTSLSQELEIACIYFKLTMDDLAQLQLNAIDHAFANQSEKVQLSKKVKNFIQNRFENRLFKKNKAEK